MTVTESRFEQLTYGSDRLDRLIAAIGEGALERERTGERPFAAIDLVRRERLGALRVPRGDGGGGASLRELFAVVIALATVDVNVAHIRRGHFAHVEERLRLDAGERQRVTELALSGAIVGNASTELGSTPAGAFTWKTRLTHDGDAFLLNGTKYFTTGTLYADYAEVLALVPTDRTGVTVLDDWDGMGQRATGTGTATFENVAVAPDDGAIRTARHRQRAAAGVPVGCLLPAVRDRTRGRRAARAPRGRGRARAPAGAQLHVGADAVSSG